MLLSCLAKEAEARVVGHLPWAKLRKSYLQKGFIKNKSGSTDSV